MSGTRDSRMPGSLSEDSVAKEVSDASKRNSDGKYWPEQIYMHTHDYTKYTLNTTTGAIQHLKGILERRAPNSMPNSISEWREAREMRL